MIVGRKRARWAGGTLPIGAVKGGDQDARNFVTSNARSQHRVIARVAMNKESNKIAVTVLSPQPWLPQSGSPGSRPTPAGTVFCGAS